MATAFEAITTRQSWYAGEAISKYAAVSVHTDGRLVKAVAGRPFAGICEYAAEAADDMVTVVKGSYPAIATENVTVGAMLTLDSAAAGKFRIADTAADVIYGTAVTAADAGDLFTIMLSDVSIVHA